MKTKKFKAILIVAMMIPVFVLAQRPDRPKDPQQRLDHLFSEIPDLSDDQKASIQTLFDDFENSLRALRENENLQKDEKHEQFKSLHDTFNNDMENLLTEEQMEIFARMQKNHTKQGMLNPDGHKPGPPDFENAELQEFILNKRIAFNDELSKSEKATIVEIRTLMEENHQQLGENKVNMSRADHRARIRQHMEDMEPLFQIADAHEASLKQIREEIYEFIAESHTEDLPGCEPPEQIADMRPKPEMHKDVHFLLMNIDGASAISNRNVDTGFDIFPNPVKDIFTIRFKLTNDGMVSIELLNKQGELLEVLDSSIRNAGLQELEVNTNGLKDHEVYFIRINSPQKVMVEKFLKIQG